MKDLIEWLVQPSKRVDCKLVLQFICIFIVLLVVALGLGFVLFLLSRIPDTIMVTIIAAAFVALLHCVYRKYKKEMK